MTPETEALLNALSPQRRKFLEVLWADPRHSQAAAYRKVYGVENESTARTNAWRLLTKADVRAAWEALRRERYLEYEVDADRLRQEVARIAFFDPRCLTKTVVLKQLDGTERVIEQRRELSELDEDAAAGVAGVEVIEQRVGKDSVVYLHKIRLADKVAAQRLLAQLGGLLTEKRELSGKVTLEELVAKANE